ncbi:MAG: benzene 1,2-dioxygenase [Salinisphaeraceae bacterium]|nr:benzene 1,2-dioxygenase [Salinisphaeraceae bacterium]
MEAQARDCVIREGWLLDQRDWDAWVALYTEDAEYWLPSWDDEYNLTQDPLNELSHIYYSDRTGLEDRVFRLRTERSLASTPLPRTCHMIQVAQVQREGDDIVVGSNWTTHSYRHGTASYFFGQQTHRLRDTEAGLRIAARKVVVANDCIPNVLDIYSV